MKIWASFENQADAQAAADTMTATLGGRFAVTYDAKLSRPFIVVSA